MIWTIWAVVLCLNVVVGGEEGVVEAILTPGVPWVEGFAHGGDKHAFRVSGLAPDTMYEIRLGMRGTVSPSFSFFLETLLVRHDPIPYDDDRCPLLEPQTALEGRVHFERGENIGVLHGEEKVVFRTDRERGPMSTDASFYVTFESIGLRPVYDIEDTRSTRGGRYAIGKIGAIDGRRTPLSTSTPQRMCLI